MRRVFDQALGGQAPQRLAHRAAAHGEAHREVAFDEARSRRQPPRENVAPKPLDDVGDRRAMRGRPPPAASIWGNADAGSSIHFAFPKE